MTTATEIISEAYREGNLIPIGTSPTTAEQTEGLAKLNRILSGLFGNELGEQLQTWPVPPPQRTAGVAARYPLGVLANDLPSDVWPYPPSNVRIMCSLSADTTVYLQNDPADGARLSFMDIGMTAAKTATLDGNGRLIEGSTTRAVVAGEADIEPLSWFFRADIGDWVSLVVLALTDDMPLPAEFDDYFITSLAIGLSPRHGRSPHEATVAANKRELVKLKARYRQITSVPGGASEIPESWQSYPPGGGL